MTAPLPAPTDLTVLVLASTWNAAAHARTLHSVQRLRDGTGARVQALLLELLEHDPAGLVDGPLPALPVAWQAALASADHDYVCDHGCTARALRRAVRSCAGHWVCLLHEGDEIGWRADATTVLARRDLDALITLPAVGEHALAAHRALATLPPAARAVGTLVALAGAYCGGLVVRRDWLDDVLGHVGYDAEPGYSGYLAEVLTLAALRGPARLAFTEALAVFPTEPHGQRHRDRVGRYVWPVLPLRRRDLPQDTDRRLEPRSEALFDALLDHLRALALNEPAAQRPRTPSAQAERLRRDSGRPTGAMLALLDWAVAQWCRQWERPLPAALQAQDPLLPWRPAPLPPPAALPAPQVSLITSAFRGEAVAFSFLDNLLRLDGFEARAEAIVVCPQPNLAQDLVLGHFALVTPQVRLEALDADPGIYGCWNHAIGLARGRYLSNANLDDRRDRRQLARLVDWLEATGADLASAAVAITHDAAELTTFAGDVPALAAAHALECWFAGGSAGPRALEDFFLRDAGGAVTQCMNFPHCMPVWRRDLHARFAPFDEAAHGTYADFALWLRAVAGGARVLHDPQPLGLYHVDPASHNRRHADARTWDAIVRPFLPPGTVVHAPVHVAPRRAARTDAGTGTGGAPGNAAPRFDFGAQLAQHYGTHRSGWTYVLQAFEPFHAADAEVECHTFLEKRFVWGSDPGDGGCGPVRPFTRPWVGFLHVPPGVPGWFQAEQSPARVLSLDSWRRSQRECRGLFVLSDYHRRWLEQTLRPAFPISVLLHPTEFVDEAFSMDRYLANPDKRLVQVGWWLRKLAAVNHLQVPGLKPTLLGRDWTKNMMRYAERRVHGLTTVPPVDQIGFLENDEYDRLLAENLVFVDFYDTSANNAVIECIARATPIVVCRHPAVEEYVGADYPLYFDHPADIPRLLADHGRIAAAHACLKAAALRDRLTLQAFARDFAASEVVRHACT
ncbi:hypothetical protein [Rubrivivax albus]|uniref:Glycosyltransferase n=1 Tax=Rubrivivax albus TaxID=2499835 RepID=A0A437JRG9_9BURK|nr:hypothetical protein [Rubrivivax albus]RVT49464.1 hypothetical protein ENE75_20560 [Rubrivivax albus]